MLKKKYYYLTCYVVKPVHDPSSQTTLDTSWSRSLQRRLLGRSGGSLVASKPPRAIFWITFSTIALTSRLRPLYFASCAAMKTGLLLRGKTISPSGSQRWFWDWKIPKIEKHAKITQNCLLPSTSKKQPVGNSGPI